MNSEERVARHREEVAQMRQVARELPGYIIAQEYERRTCAADGHQPHTSILTFADPIPVSINCRCGEVSWVQGRNS